MNPNCELNQKQISSENNERITLLVVIITLTTMIAEITAGILSGSMALLSDGIHMGTHALALFITLAAYVFARKHSQSPHFSFGTGKVGVLAGYTNAILLILAGLAMAYESVERLISPVHIRFNEAIVVAMIGLIVNIGCAIILGHGNNDHGHNHSRNHNHHNHDLAHRDHNLQAAYLHVITDALTSILAITALLLAKFFGFIWADPLVGILGAAVVVKWAIGLIRQTGSILLDVGDFTPDIKKIRQLLESDGTIVKDIHIWQISENERSLIVSLQTDTNKTPKDYHNMIKELSYFEHITVEVNNETRITKNAKPAFFKTEQLARV
ncbi:MAG: CDF family Co(II)/Ni(II) efflux transporter DmeF [Proteobacteria bacterium]|nr:CDF family Co(II)/Ni(II) efflux transporter DmeF [Pseudomonadota bacterium]